MKTIKELADEIGVSKQAVRNVIDKLELQSSLQKIGNHFAIDFAVEKLIKQTFSKTERKPLADLETQSVGDIVCVLQANFDTLHAQLEVKDRQLAAAETEKAKLYDLLETQQKLHAGTLQKMLEAPEDPPEIHEEINSDPDPVNVKIRPADDPDPHGIRERINRQKAAQPKKKHWIYKYWYYLPIGILILYILIQWLLNSGHLVIN